MLNSKKVSIRGGFDEKLFVGGVEEGAFAGEKDADTRWYILEAAGEKVALASAVPGPGELVTICYFVHPDHRGNGYGTKIASVVTDLHENATFTIFKDNEASIKIALAALREKFSVTMGHNVVRLTKTADDQEKQKKPGMNPALMADDIALSLRRAFKAPKIAAAKKKEEPKAEESNKMPAPPLISYLDDVAMILKGLKSEAPLIAKAAGHKDEKDTVGTALEATIHEGFTTAADRLYRAGLLTTHERISLSGAIGQTLGEFRRKVRHDVHTRKMTENAHEHLKAAMLRSTAERALRTRILQARKFTSGFARMRGVESSARSVQALPATELQPSDRKQILMSIRGLKGLVNPGKGGDIYKDIRAAEGKTPQKELFG